MSFPVQLFFAFFGILGMSFGQLLTVEYVGAKLPVVNICPTPYYDGGDNIYLFGGCTIATYFPMLVYSLSSDTIERVGILPAPGIRGNLQQDNFGNIFYFGGNSGREIFKIDLVSNTSTVVADVQFNIQDTISFKFNDTSPIVYILGAPDHGGEVLAFDLESFNYSILTDITVDYNVNRGTSVRVGDKEYIFAWEGEKSALELDLNTLQMRKVGPSSLPRSGLFSSSVGDGGNLAYFMGGYPLREGPIDGLFQFDTNTFENTFLPVRNFPVGGLDYLQYAPALVHVPGLNRIYCFGGETYNATLNGGVTHDQIFYIDLTPKDFFSCANRTTGFYPNPMNCSMYIGCQDEEMTFFTCPPPLLYDPALTTCNVPDEVECGLSCEDKPDGNHPHPHDCSLYVSCGSGLSNILKCPPPLLFDPVELNCASPELVPCSVRA